MSFRLPIVSAMSASRIACREVVPRRAEPLELIPRERDEQQAFARARELVAAALEGQRIEIAAISVRAAGH